MIRRPTGSTVLPCTAVLRSKARMVITVLRGGNCSLKWDDLMAAGAEVDMRVAPERVRAPFLVSATNWSSYEESCTLILVH